MSYVTLKYDPRAEHLRYSVRGWSIRQAKLEDTIDGEWKEGDILYEVTLRRKDPVPMDQVTWRPTSAEVDDYTEYKRLRKLYRDQRHEVPQEISTPQQVVKAAPTIASHQLPAIPTTSPPSLQPVPPSVSRQTTLEEHAFDARTAEADRPSASAVVSPTTISGLQAPFAPQKVGTLAVPAPTEKSRPGTPALSDTALREKQGRVQSQSSNSLASTKSGHGELKEIIPWIDMEAEILAPPALTTLSSVTEQTKGQTRERLEVKAVEMNAVKTAKTLARDPRQPSELSKQSHDVRAMNIATIALNLRLHSKKSTIPIFRGKKGDESEGNRKKNYRYARKARFFDGAGYSVDEEDDKHHAATSRYRCFRSSSVDDRPILPSPRPVKLPRPISLFNYGIENVRSTSPLDNFTHQPRAVSPIDSVLVAHLRGSQTIGESIALGKLRRWLSK